MEGLALGSWQGWRGALAALCTARIVLASLSTNARKAHSRTKAGLQEAAALGIWIANPLGAVVGSCVAAALLATGACSPVYALAFLATLVALMALPLELRPPEWVEGGLRWIMSTGMRYFPAGLHWEDKDAFREGQSYVFGFEPHSIMPFGMMLLSPLSPARLPPALARCRVLMSTACFVCPINRHLWWWLGGRPASKRAMSTLLAKGTSVVLCPGGVREVIYMQPGSEHAFLRSRRGFVRLALQHGSALVPMFAFGQSQQFAFWRLGIDWPYLMPRAWAERLSRAIGFLPLLVAGAWGSLMPARAPMRVVVGRPIPVPKVASPSEELVEHYLQRYIAEMEGLFERHKASAGHPNEKLTVH